MAILEIDQIKRSEKDAADLIEASQRRKTLVIPEKSGYNESIARPGATAINSQRCRECRTRVLKSNVLFRSRGVLSCDPLL